MPAAMSLIINAVVLLAALIQVYILVLDMPATRAKWPTDMRWRCLRYGAASTMPIEDAARAAWPRLALGLALTPCAAGLSAALFSAAPVAAGLADALAFAGGALLPIFGLALAARYQGALGVTLSLAALASAVLLALAFGVHASPSIALSTVDTALVALAWSAGTSIGRRVQHASHLLPACVVAASADLVSVLSPEGPSHAIAQSDRALSALATWFPVPGSHALAPALGVGDLLFMGLALGVARAQSLPYARTVLLCVLGSALAGLAAARSGVAIPALLPIGVCLIAGLPAVRALRRSERKAALLSMLIAGSIALASIARYFWVRS